MGRADHRLLGALGKTVSTEGWRRGGDEWNAFVRVSLRPESRSWIALEKQYFFRGSLCFQLVFFVSSKRLYDIHVTWFDRFLHRKRARGPLVFRGPTQLAYSAYRADRLCRCVWLGRHTKCAVLGGAQDQGWETLPYRNDKIVTVFAYEFSIVF